MQEVGQPAEVEGEDDEAEPEADRPDDGPLLVGHLAEAGRRQGVEVAQGQAQQDGAAHHHHRHQAVVRQLAGLLPLAPAAGGEVDGDLEDRGEEPGEALVQPGVACPLLYRQPGVRRVAQRPAPRHRVEVLGPHY